MAITAKQVKALRDATGAGMMDCKRALNECDGDLDAAKLYLQKKGIADNKKRAGRTASEGTLTARSTADGLSAVLLELNCETDFVGRNDDFVAFAAELTQLAVDATAGDVAALEACEIDGQVVRERMLEQSGKTGEKLVLRRLDWAEVGAEFGGIGSYVHDGKIGAVVALSAASADDSQNDGFKALAKDIAMHITASDPSVVSGADLDRAEVARQTEIFTAQAKDSGKPENIVAKIVIGRVNKWKREVSLLDQPFVKNTANTIKAQIAEVSKNLSGPAVVVSFVRYRLGEGIEKNETNLAAEVAAMTS